MVVASKVTCTTDMQKPGFFWERVNPLPDDKILDWFKFKQIADDI